jgi:hypothetical protein
MPHGGTAPNTSFAAGLKSVLSQLGGVIKSTGPALANMFKASLPFLHMFVSLGLSPGSGPGLIV